MPDKLLISCLTFLLVLTGLRVAGYTFPEDDGLIINITANTSVSLTKYHVDIYKTNSSIKIVYSFLDSIQLSKLENDTLYSRLNKFIRSKSFSINSKEGKTIVNELIALREKNEVYTRDSITIKTSSDTSYVNLLNVIANSSIEKLENKIGNKTRIVLDGTGFTYRIKTSQRNDTAYAHSPTLSSNPLLYKLLVLSLDVYRNRKNNDFLNKQKTTAY